MSRFYHAPALKCEEPLAEARGSDSAISPRPTISPAVTLTPALSLKGRGSGERSAIGGQPDGARGADAGRDSRVGACEKDEDEDSLLRLV